MNLVLFDLDNTLLAGDSDYEWGQFLIAKGVVDGAHYEARNKAFYDDYKAGRLDIYAFLAFALRPLATHRRAQLDAWHAEYMETRVKPMITQAARDLVRQHLDEADLVAIITATNSFVTAPIAREFGVPHLIATDPECIDGHFTGEVAGTAVLSRRQDHPTGTVPRTSRHPARLPDVQPLLQRFAERPAAAGKSPASGGGRPRPDPAQPRAGPRLAGDFPAASVDASLPRDVGEQRRASGFESVRFLMVNYYQIGRMVE